MLTLARVCLLAFLASATGSFVGVEVVNDGAKLGCYPAAFAGEDKSLTDVPAAVASPPDACEKLSGVFAGKTVVVRRGGCTFGTKIERVLEAGGVAMIVVNDELDAPIEMSMSEGKNDPNARYDQVAIEPNGIGIPACMAFSDAWNTLAGGGVRLSWAGFRKYDASDERLPEHELTSIEISQRGSPDEFDTAPAAQATFNPASLSASGKAVRVQLHGSCFDKADCNTCWGLPHPIVNHGDVFGNIAVFYLDDSLDNCLSWQFEITMMAQSAGATALIYVNVNEMLWTWTPWLVPFDVTIPTFNIFRSDGKKLLDRLALGEEVTLRTPVLTNYPNGCNPDKDVCIASGPSYSAGSTPSLPLTALVFADYTDAEEPQTLVAAAGQAHFNPEIVPAQGTEQTFFAFQKPVVNTYFPSKCSSEVAINTWADACDACQADGDVLAKMGVLTDMVALIRMEDAGCVGSFQRMVEAAQDLGAAAVVFGAAGDQIGTLTAEQSFQAEIPVFVIGEDDARWLHERAEYYSSNPWDFSLRRELGELSEVRGFLPVIADGVATQYDNTYALESYQYMVAEINGEPTGAVPIPPVISDGREEDPIRMTRITVAAGADKYTVTAAVARFMSPTYPSVVGDAVWPQWWSCSSLNTCGACRKAMCTDIQNRGDLSGRVAVIWDEDVPCFSDQDVSEAAYCAQQAGASAVLFVSDSGVRPMEPQEELLPTHFEWELCLDGRYRQFCMPVFSISGIAAVKMRNELTCAGAASGSQGRCVDDLSRNPSTRIELPGHHENPTPFQKPGSSAADAFLSGADSAKNKPKIPIWGIVVLVVSLVFMFIACAVAVRRIRRRRAAAMADSEQAVTRAMIEEEPEDSAVVIEADPNRFRPAKMEVDDLPRDAPYDPSLYGKARLGYGGLAKGESGKHLMTPTASQKGLMSPTAEGGETTPSGVWGEGGDRRAPSLSGSERSEEAGPGQAGAAAMEEITIKD